MNVTLMRTLQLAVPFLLGQLLCAATLPGDSREGARVFRQQRCIECHSLNGEGGTSAPELGRRTGRDYTPAGMAAMLWNHAPGMWTAMNKADVASPRLSEDDAAHLFAYFWAHRYFDKPGDAGRGKKAFETNHCADCHAPAGVSGATGAPPLEKWDALFDPIALSAAMWNHIPAMRAEMAKRAFPWPALTSQEMTDISVYLQNLPQMRGRQPTFSPASAETGETLFRVKGCASCHVGRMAIENRVVGRSMNDLVVALWNHGQRIHDMRPAPLSAGEMRRLVGYLYSIQFFHQPGDAAEGERVFEAKRCGSCHGRSAPALGGKSMNSFGMVAALWAHGPQMKRQMEQKKLVWPSFRTNEMADLIAFLNKR